MKTFKLLSFLCICCVALSLAQPTVMKLLNTVQNGPSIESGQLVGSTRSNAGPPAIYNSSFVSNLLENCDKCYHDRITSDTAAIETFILNDLDVLRIVEAAAATSDDTVTGKVISAASNNNKILQPLEGIWKLRYSSAKWRAGYRGLPSFRLYLNATSTMAYNEIEFLENTKSLKKMTIAVKLNPTLSETDIINQHNVNSLFQTSLKFIDYERSAFIPLLRKISLSWPLNIQPLRSLLSFFIMRRRFPSLCSLSQSFEVIYQDEDVHVQLSDDGKYNVYSRLYQVWEPSKGWTLISAV